MCMLSTMTSLALRGTDIDEGRRHIHYRVKVRLVLRGWSLHYDPRKPGQVLLTVELPRHADTSCEVLTILQIRYLVNACVNKRSERRIWRVVIAGSQYNDDAING